MVLTIVVPTFQQALIVAFFPRLVPRLVQLTPDEKVEELALMDIQGVGVFFFIFSLLSQLLSDIVLFLVCF